ncbi:hypothetical protein MRX96_025004 [Rhipicephalus microplus]
MGEGGQRENREKGGKAQTDHCRAPTKLKRRCPGCSKRVRRAAAQRRGACADGATNRSRSRGATGEGGALQSAVVASLITRLGTVARPTAVSPLFSKLESPPSAADRRGRYLASSAAATQEARRRARDRRPLARAVWASSADGIACVFLTAVVT